MLAQRIVGVRAPLGLTMRASFTSYALSHTLGFGAITGGSARLRIYGTAGIPAGQSRAHRRHCRGIVLGRRRDRQRDGDGVSGRAARPWHHDDPACPAHVVGALVLGAVLTFTGVAAFRPALLKPLEPVLGTLRGQTVLELAVVSTVDLACSSLALYLLLPHAEWQISPGSCWPMP
jgi:phosphatidylglycerol lysyltransferase